MFKKITPFILFLTLALLMSCSESTTGSNPDTDQSGPNEESGETTPTTGTLEITTTTSGNTTDEDGFTVEAGDDNSQSIGTDETITFEELEVDTYSVELSGLAAACRIDGDNPVSAEVTADETTTVEFKIICEESTAEGTIVFTQRVDGVAEIFSIQADGSDKQQLTNAGRENGWLDTSPDGTKIAFTQQNAETTKYDIWVMGIDGSNLMQLTSTQTEDRHPSWSPDGSQIVFESDREGNFNLYVMDADGANQTALTSSDANEIQPSWAPEGDQIAFTKVSGEQDVSEIYVIKTDGTGLEKLFEATTSNGINLFDPEWSPDASKIAYQGFATDGGTRVFVSDADGSNAEMLTGGSVSAYHPTWSPDGNYIAFTNLASVSNSDEIWIIKTDGSSSTRLTAEEAYSAFPSWGITVE